MIQTALELIYNWLIIEEKMILRGRDAENISASNKIRLLLSQLNLEFRIPDTLVNLTKYKENNSDIIDAPELFVQIRNAIVHSQAVKRKKLAEMDDMVKFEALHMGIWYVELALLKILGFNDKYMNRCAGGIFPGNSLQYVPWSRLMEDRMK